MAIPSCSDRTTQRPTNAVRVHRLSHCLIAVLLGVALAGCSSNDIPVANAVVVASSPTVRAMQKDRERLLARKYDERDALRRANVAYQENRVIAPAGNNALEYALQAREVNVESAGANELLTDIMPLVTTQVQQMIAAGQFDEADRVIGLLHKAHPDSMTTLSLHRQMHRANSMPPMVVVASVPRDHGRFSNR